MSNLEKACFRIFILIMIGLGFILWVQLQSCAPPIRIQPDTIDEIKIDSTLA